MINWLTIVAHASWIAGLALILAALSYHNWLAGQAGHSLRAELAGQSFQRVLLVGMLLVGLGLSGISRGAWQQVLAGVVVVGAIAGLVWRWRRG
ncbi:MAG TPA: hypothetical protein PK829_03020 [Promineifilum sp.]|nr:hypothetical protein [Promineifilum sp.]HQF70878.1 hypothetical protein [Promineifilum sp.]